MKYSCPIHGESEAACCEYAKEVEDKKSEEFVPEESKLVQEMEVPPLDSSGEKYEECPVVVDSQSGSVTVQNGSGESTDSVALSTDANVNFDPPPSEPEVEEPKKKKSKPEVIKKKSPKVKKSKTKH